jgi:hypothetical protein
MDGVAPVRKEHCVVHPHFEFRAEARMLFPNDGEVPGGSRVFLIATHAIEHEDDVASLVGDSFCVFRSTRIRFVLPICRGVTKA